MLRQHRHTQFSRFGPNQFPPIWMSTCHVVDTSTSESVARRVVSLVLRPQASVLNCRGYFPAEAVAQAFPVSQSGALDTFAARTPLQGSYTVAPQRWGLPVGRRPVLMDARVHRVLDGFALVRHHHRGRALLAPATSTVVL